MICSSPLQVFKDLVPNCRGGEQFVNPRLVMVHLKGPIKYRYMLFRRGLDHKPFASKGTGTPQKNSEYSPLPLIPKLWSYKSTDAQMKLLLYCWRPCLAVTTTLFHFYFVFTRMHSHSTSFVHAILFNNFTKFSGSSLTKDLFLDVFLCKILCTLNVWPLSGLHGSWF